MELEGEGAVAFSGGGGSGGNGELFHVDEHPLELQPEVGVNDKVEVPSTSTTTTDNRNHNDNERDEDDDDVDAGDDLEEEVEEEEEEGYRFMFSEGMDPLSFTKEDPSGFQPYEQFERLENQYEALAAKKRKARHLNEPSQSSSQAQDREVPAKKPRLEDVSGATMEEIMEVMNFGMSRRSRKHKKRGRRKGSRNKLSPEVTRKLGDATLQYALGRYAEAIGMFYEVILLSPNLPDPYHRLGLIYNEMGDKKRALDLYMIAAHLTPKDASLWKLLVTWSIEQGDRGQAKYCLSKALTADPEDINLRFHRASLFVELGDYLKAADSYEQISRLCPENAEILKTAAQLYKKCGQHEHAVSILENFLRDHPSEVDLSVIDQLASLHMEVNAHLKALEQIEKVSSSGKEMPLHLVIKAGICSVHLGQMERADTLFQVLQHENIHDQRHLIFEVGDSLMNHGHYESALEYYMMLVGDTGKNNGYLHLKIAECYHFLRKRLQSIDHFYKALDELQDSVDVGWFCHHFFLKKGKMMKQFLSFPLLKNQNHHFTWILIQRSNGGLMGR